MLYKNKEYIILLQITKALSKMGEWELNQYEDTVKELIETFYIELEYKIPVNSKMINSVQKLINKRLSKFKLSELELSK